MKSEIKTQNNAQLCIESDYLHAPWDYHHFQDYHHSHQIQGYKRDPWVDIQEDTWIEKKTPERYKKRE